MPGDNPADKIGDPNDGLLNPQELELAIDNQGISDFFYAVKRGGLNDPTGSVIVVNAIFELAEQPEILLFQLQILKTYLEDNPDAQEFLTNLGINVGIEKIKTALDTTIELGTAFIERKKANDPNENLIRKFHNRLTQAIGSGKRPTRRRAIKGALESLNEILGKIPGNNNVKNIVNEHEAAFIKSLEPLLHESFKNGLLTHKALYARPELWIALGKSDKYISFRTGLELLRKHLPEIIDIVAPDAENVKIYDLGIGDGKKSREIIKIFNEKGKRVDYQAVDTGEIMLKVSAIMITEYLVNYVLEQKDSLECYKEFVLSFYQSGRQNEAKEFEEKIREIERSTWYPFIDLCLKNNLSFSEHLLLRDVLYRIFYKFFIRKNDKDPVKSDNGNPDLIKHLAARMLSLHVGRPTDEKIIKTLDDDVRLPVTLNPKVKAIEDIPADEFKNTDEGTRIVAFDLGCRICNSHPEKIIKKYSKMLSRPVLPKEVQDPVPVCDESKIKSPYLVTGFQVSHFDQNSPEFEKERARILKGYDTEASMEFITYPFKFGFIYYYNGATGENMNFKDLLTNKMVEIITDYEADPESPEFYRIVHRLKFNQSVIIKVNDSDPILKKPGDSIVILYSYKPTLEQMVKLFEQNDLKVCKIFKDNDTCTKYAKLLIRRMTIKEKNEYLKKQNPDEP